MEDYSDYFELRKINDDSYELTLLNIWNKQILTSNIKKLEKLTFSSHTKLTVDFQNLKECDTSSIIYLISFFKKVEEKNLTLKNLDSFEEFYRFYEKHYQDNSVDIKDKKNIGVPPVKTCKSCNAVVNTSAKICEYCGAEFEEQIKKEYETKLIELTYERLNGKYINSLTIEELILVAERKKWKQQFVERIIYHNLGIDKLNDFWNNKNYKHGYRIRRLDLFKSETPTKNFKVNL